MNKTLQDFGEFNLLEKVVFPALKEVIGPVNLGDDCGVLPLPVGAEQLVVTTDVAPIPLVWHLGCKSYDTFGWYAVTVNVSDLAAGGAEPLAFSNSVEAPPNMLVSDFKAFFVGMAEACRFYNIWVSGGNIRSASSFECHGTAIGLLRGRMPFTRRGLKSGDVILSIGHQGNFMSGAILVLKKMCTIHELSKDFRESLLRPIARIREAKALGELGVVKAAIDNSDGILIALHQLAELSGVDIEIEMVDKKLPEHVRQVANKVKCDPWNLAFSWGDYQLIVGVEAASVPRVEAVLQKLNTPYTVLGIARPGKGKVWALRGGSRKILRRLGNENFTNLLSYNDTPLEEFVNRIIYEDLYEPTII